MGSCLPRRGAVLAVIAFALSLGSPQVAPAAPSSFAAPVSIARGHQLDAVACPTTRFCIAISEDDWAATTADPAGGARAWSLHRMGGDAPQDVSCATSSLCVAIDLSGYALSTTRPSGGARAWKAVALDPVDPGCHSACLGPELTGVACPSVHLCVVIDDGGSVFTSTRPTGGRRAWHRTRVADGLASISCPSTKLCVASTEAEYGGEPLSGDPDRAVVVSTHPAGGRRTWHRYRAAAGAPRIASVSCATVHLCLAATSTNCCADARYTTHPTSPTAWRTALSFSSGSPRVGLFAQAVTCGAADSCMADAADTNGHSHIFISDAPTTSDWEAVSLYRADITALTCTGSSLCVLVTEHGRAIVGT